MLWQFKKEVRTGFASLKHLFVGHQVVLIDHENRITALEGEDSGEPEARSRGNLGFLVSNEKDG